MKESAPGSFIKYAPKKRSPGRLVAALPASCVVVIADLNGFEANRAGLKINLLRPPTLELARNLPSAPRSFGITFPGPHPPCLNTPHVLNISALFTPGILLPSCRKSVGPLIAAGSILKVCRTKYGVPKRAMSEPYLIAFAFAPIAGALGATFTGPPAISIIGVKIGKVEANGCSLASGAIPTPLSS